jgi:N-methylhydantoinase A
VPRAPGLLCALGLLVEPLRLDLVRTRVEALDALSPAEVNRRFEAMEAEAQRWLDRESIPRARRRLLRALDMRYVGQNFELIVAAPPALWQGDLGALRQAFRAEHDRTYGYSADDEAVQIVAARLTALGGAEPLDLPRLPGAPGPDPGAARAGERSAYFAEAGGFVATPLYRRERLLGGHRIEGPAIVEQMDSTTVILPGQRAVVDDRANLLIDTGDDPWIASPSR